MKSLEKKIKKTELLIKARKAQLDTESQSLALIRQRKIAQLQELDRHQKNYINGVNDLNIERQTGDRRMLSTIERSVDHSKSQWYKSLREVKTWEEKEKQQIEQVLLAQRNLKSMEKVQENHFQALKKEVDVREQKEMDDLSVQRFARNR
ncbi:hypothetical protein [Pseudobacteriovorax antillogorgiicola]|uniref:Flagellar FliJ protein n=1 Tax=Pseudobacteriovorax antillogorgiicola TaxID=1513793 RepID=A0A1Y6CS74_9BACT|nr:hypothetical protein [Pseudobacteriovorax antillogorgiicola]TCS46118.1 hypothetical protein EDD56_12519 [Pseudobacteriovorax antillogorgiicola]SMF69516.1 hypothetical protein SAMN06296036_12519 [Pseudobacteriovorax antillogorgiicola]